MLTEQDRVVLRAIFNGDKVVCGEKYITIPGYAPWLRDNLSDGVNYMADMAEAVHTTDWNGIEGLFDVFEE